MQRVMTWEEIDKDWNGLQKRHRSEIAQAVARYCVGHSISEVAKHLNQSRDWVQSRLDFAGVSTGVGTPTPLLGKSNGAMEDAQRIVREFAPTDDDAEQFEPYLQYYMNEGHQPAAATRLAKAEWAAEAAVKAGVIQESTNKRNEKVNQILFPEDAKDTFELDLKHHMARVKATARFLDEAKMNHIRRKSTCEKVAEANEAWSEQVDRILNLHPTFNKES